MISVSPLISPTISQLNQIIMLYRMQNWWGKSPDEIGYAKRIITGSHCFMVAETKDRIVGMGRAISDGVSDAYIQDLVVDTKYRRQKIGSRIVQKLVNTLEDDGLSWIGVVAEDKSSHAIYHNNGFKPKPPAQFFLKQK